MLWAQKPKRAFSLLSLLLLLPISFLKKCDASAVSYSCNFIALASAADFFSSCPGSSLYLTLLSMTSLAMPQWINFQKIFTGGGWGIHLSNIYVVIFSSSFKLRLHFSCPQKSARFFSPKVWARKWEVQGSFETFLKNHPFWHCQASKV